LDRAFFSSENDMNGNFATCVWGAAATTPAVLDFPTMGVAGSTITISGINFSTIAANNIVSFNGIPATVISATTTQLVVTIPATATPGYITVTVGGQTGTSARSFNFVSAVFQGGLTWMPATELTWTPSTQTNSIVYMKEPWSNANSICAGFNGLGLTGWRLPTKIELISIYNSGAMKSQGWFRYWSSSPSNTGHYSVDPNNGIDYMSSDTAPNLVSCVR